MPYMEEENNGGRGGDRVSMLQGAGGEAMQRLIKNVFGKHLHSTPASEAHESGWEILIGIEKMDDAGVIGEMVFTIDGHTVKPIFYPGGDIGRLSVSGTINDLAAMGATPLALANSVFIEDGFPIRDLEKIARSMGETSREAGVPVITGDTKVVEKGSVDGIYISTAGIGTAEKPLKRNRAVCEELGRKVAWLEDTNIRAGDVIIVSGYVGDHGTAILSAREGYGFDSSVKSDTAPLNGLVEKALYTGGVVAAKDPTRGGVANALNEWAEKSSVGIVVYEEKIPVREEVRGACDLLGIDPLNIGNEGKMLFAVLEEKAEEVLAEIKKHPLGRDAEIIGYASSDISGVVLETVVGGRRMLEPPVGDPVPRIC